MKDFNGKLIYITGGSSGIGLEMAKIFAARGADLLLLARNENKLKEAKSAIEQSRRLPSQKVWTMSVDVADNADVEKKMGKAVAECGAPDILINSAGINKYADHFRNINHDMFDEVIKINLYGVRNVTHALLESMIQKKGHIVILSSAAGLFGMFGYTAYGTSKAALLGFAESLRYEIKPLGMHVTVICPPEVDTPMNIDEAKTLPEEGRAVKGLGGFLMPGYAARVIVRAIEKNTYMYIPGASTRFLYALHRLTNGWISRVVADMVIKKTRKKLLIK